MSTETAATSADPAIRPFRVDIAEEAIVDLRRRVSAWRPPEREPVDDQSQGVQLATVQDLANYWANGIRLAEIRGATECAPAVHDRNRRTRYCRLRRSVTSNEETAPF